MLQLLTLRNRRHSNVDISDGIMFISSRALLSGLLKWLAFRSIIKNEWLCLSSGVVESTMIGKIIGDREKEGDCSCRINQ
jgi:hypothetical protein